MMDPNSAFGEIMQEAVKIKGAQQQKQRVIFDSWPQYLQNSMFMKSPVTDLRSKGFVERYEGALSLKLAGTEMFKTQNYQKAQEEYEKGLAVFKFCINIDETWKKKGINDDSMQLINYEGDTKEEKTKVKEFMLSCYLNIAACQLKLENYRLCIRACDDALALDPTNAKALYRRSVGLITPPSAGSIEYDLALECLQKAIKSDPSSLPIKKLLRQLLEDRTKQRVHDKKTFTGLFNRGSIVKEEDIEDLTKKEAIRKAQVEQQIYDAKQLCNFYERKGDKAAAQELMEKIKKLEAVPKNKRQALDFLNPTEEMVEDAKKNGIDLNDKAVRQILQELQEEKEKEQNLPKDRIPIPISRMKTDPAGTIVDSMSREDLLQILKAENLRIEDISTDKELKVKYCNFKIQID